MAKIIQTFQIRKENLSENDKISFRITPEEDAEYMDAVENGDMEKASPHPIAFPFGQRPLVPP